MSASPGGKIPPVIIEAILVRLPTKSLGRFKSVSKTWNSLISHPQFIRTHRHCHRTTKLIMLSDTKSLLSVDIDKLLLYPTANDIPATAKEISLGSIRWEKILGSCNGLVLVKDIWNGIILMNPTTFELWNVPTNPPELFLYGECYVIYGFGYDPSTDDYKVVSILYWDDDIEVNPNGPPTVISVYSLRNNLWTKLHNNFSYPFHQITNSCVSINQNLHWLTPFTPFKPLEIVVFSLENEVFSEIKLPDCIKITKSLSSYGMVDVGGKLSLYFNFGVTSDIWVMEEYGVSESWTKFCIHGLKMDFISPLCLVEGTNKNIVLGHEGEVYVCNIEARGCRNVRIEASPIGMVVIGKYVESLESPKRFITS